MERKEKKTQKESEKGRGVVRKRIQERVKRRELLGAGESCPHTRWRLGESGPVWGKRNICAYYRSTQRTRRGAGERPRSPTWAGPHQTPHAGFEWPNLRLSALLVISIWKSEAGASSVSNSWVGAGEWLKSLEEVEAPTPPSPMPYALSGKGLLNGSCCGVISTWSLLKIMDDNAIIREGKEWGNWTHYCREMAMIAADITVCQNWNDSLKESIIISGALRTYMMLIYAFPSACHNCILSESNHELTCSVERNAKPMMDCIHMHQCIPYLSVADGCSIWLQHFE